MDTFGKISLETQMWDAESEENLTSKPELIV